MLSGLFSLEGKVAIVTGGSRGLGRVMVHALSEAGASVVIASRDVNKCEEVLSEIKQKGGTGMAISLDVCDADSVNSMVETVLQKFHKIDILINNAGISPFMSAIEDTKIKGFDRIMNVNVRGGLICSQAVSKNMIERKNGKIINVSSASAAVNMKGLGAYAVSKTSLVRLTEIMAYEWGPHNINVNAIAPGFMDEGVAELIPDKDNFLKDSIQHTPLRRTGKTNEIIGTVILLASDASSYITGQTIYIDGGAANC